MICPGETASDLSALQVARVASLRGFTRDAPLWLSAVLLEELYAGTADRDRPVVECKEQDFDRVKRILVP